MNCFEYRQLKLSDPSDPNTEASDHVETCANCQAFKQELSMLDANVSQAFRIAVPEGLAARIMLNHSLQQSARRPMRRLWLSMAASFLLVGVLITFQYQDTNSTSLAQANPTMVKAPQSMIKEQMIKEQMLKGPDVNNYSIVNALLTHAQHKPHDFYGNEHQPISNSQLSHILENFNVQADIENVVYAAVCPIRDGESAAHLVLKDGEDQYTMMLIPDYSPGETFLVDSATWRGFISPHPAGAMAVLADARHKAAVGKIDRVNEHLLSSLTLASHR